MIWSHWIWTYVILTILTITAYRMFNLTLEQTLWVTVALMFTRRRP